MPAYETKVIIKLMSRIVARAESLEKAYKDIAACAKDEGLVLPTFEEIRNDTEDTVS